MSPRMSSSRMSSPAISFISRAICPPRRRVTLARAGAGGGENERRSVGFPERVGGQGQSTPAAGRRW